MSEEQEARESASRVGLIVFFSNLLAALVVDVAIGQAGRVLRLVSHVGLTMAFFYAGKAVFRKALNQSQN